MKTSPRGIDLVKAFEGFRSRAYIPVPGDVPTIGYGFTRGVQMGDVMSEAEAETRLAEELAEYERGVMRATGGDVTQNQFDALVSFSFNVGVAGMARSTTIRAHKAGDYQAAARAFGLWNKSGGRVYPGLTRRRAAEAALYLERAPADEPEPMPQAIEPERPMTSSTINRASVAAGGTATLVAANETIYAARELKAGASDLGDWLVPVLLIAVVGLCAFIAWERIKIRREGWS